MSQSGNRLGLTFAVLGAVGFSFKAILIKLAYPYGVDAVTLLALRMAFSLPVFLWIGLRESRNAPPLTRSDWAATVVLPEVCSPKLSCLSCRRDTLPE